MFLKKWGVLVALLALTGCHGVSHSPTSSTDLPIIGLGEDGKAIVRYMPKGRHLNKLSGFMGEVSDKTTKSLDGFEFQEGFMLSRVSLGLEVAFEFEVLELFEMEVAPAVELRFEQLPNPNIKG